MGAAMGNGAGHQAPGDGHRYRAWGVGIGHERRAWAPGTGCGHRAFAPGAGHGRQKPATEHPGWARAMGIMHPAASTCPVCVAQPLPAQSLPPASWICGCFFFLIRCLAPALVTQLTGVNAWGGAAFLWMLSLLLGSMPASQKPTSTHAWCS